MISDEELAAWVAGEAGPAVAARIESALPDDPGLQSRVAALRRADDLLASVPGVDVPEEVADRITAAAMAVADTVLDEQAADGVVPLAGRRRMQRGGGDSSPGGAGQVGRATGSRGVGDPSGTAGRGTDGSGRWLRTVGLAAVIVAVIGVGITVVDPFSADDVDMATQSFDADDEVAGAQVAPDEEAMATDTAESATDAADDAAADGGRGTASELSSSGDTANDLAAPFAAVTRARTAPGGLVVIDAGVDFADEGAMAEGVSGDVLAGFEQAQASEPAPAPTTAVSEWGDGTVDDLEATIAETCLPADAADRIAVAVLGMVGDTQVVAYGLDDEFVLVDAESCVEVDRVAR